MPCYGQITGTDDGAEGGRKKRPRSERTRDEDAPPPEGLVRAGSGTLELSETTGHAAAAAGQSAEHPGFIGELRAAVVIGLAATAATTGRIRDEFSTTGRTDGGLSVFLDADAEAAAINRAGGTRRTRVCPTAVALAARTKRADALPGREVGTDLPFRTAIAGSALADLWAAARCGLVASTQGGRGERATGEEAHRVPARGDGKGAREAVKANAVHRKPPRGEMRTANGYQVFVWSAY